jgi:FAD:protein FMN transferase
MGVLMRSTSWMALTLALAACAAPGPAPPPARELKVVDTDGVAHDLDAALARGEAVALVFWQTWCGSCAQEAPAIVEAQRAHGARLRFVGVVPGRDDVVDDAEVARVRAAWGYAFPQVRDRDLALSRRFGVEGTPTIVVLGEGGAVKYSGHRPPPDWAPLLGAPVEAECEGGVCPMPQDPPPDEPAPAVSRTRRVDGVMGSELTIEVIGQDPEALERVLDRCVEEFRRVEDLFTDWRASPLMTLNEAAGAGPQPVVPEMLDLLERALLWGEQTDGAFDITFAAVGRLWDFKRRPVVVPDPAAIREALAFVGWSKVRLDRAAGTVDLPAGMRLGLGGIAQGWGADRAMDIILESGIRDAIVNCSGDVKALGKKDGRPWQIAIKHPRDRERAIAVLPVSNACVVTSGDYERCFELDGVRYHHIIDCRTGYPSRGCMSATVVGPSATDCDALATALCVMGPVDGLALVERLPRIECLLVDMEGEVHVSSGLRGR